MPFLFWGILGIDMCEDEKNERLTLCIKDGLFTSGEDHLNQGFLNEYKEELDFALKNQKIHNLAVTGDYDVGKTSILK